MIIPSSASTSGNLNETIDEEEVEQYNDLLIRRTVCSLDSEQADMNM